MSGNQDESPIPGPPTSSGTRSPPIIERSKPVIPDIQPHDSVPAPTMRSTIFYLHQAGLHNPSPLTPLPESKVHTHASIVHKPPAHDWQLGSK
ncbi:hypothetical protein N7516_009272 [Penicillium verrucosum]|uniref:uncharacterized protein n=1 Tax=Penicillium verrucosum TaxID=60171 RepID=UPI0025458D83|nr:uncharacterized protein N7516_009272 [Penicillium verrucosum]KAJ5927499.1 hypothetical protein N7516_009272 [Penicillium verrucosum]